MDNSLPLLDRLDRRILRVLQDDAGLNVLSMLQLRSFVGVVYCSLEVGWFVDAAAWSLVGLV